MAHMTPEEVNERAAQIAAGEQPAPVEHLDPDMPNEPTLVYGAQGADVTKLVNLLAVLGFDSNDVVKGHGTTLDESVLEDLEAAAKSLDVDEPVLTGPEDIPVGVIGVVVGKATWHALYEAAAAKLEEGAGPTPAASPDAIASAAADAAGA